MAATTGKQLAVGMRHAVIFKLDANGYPAATGSSAYEGFNIVGPKTYTLTIPDARKITHLGADRPLALDFLPPTEAMSAELQVASQDLEVNAYLTGVKTFVVGEATMMPWATDQQGYEPQVGLLLYQQSLETSTKLRNWRFHIIPRARVIPAPDGMNENAGVQKYAIAPSASTEHLWGEALTTGSEGATEVSVLEGAAEGRPTIVAFKGNGATTAFLLPADKPAKTVAKVVCWVDGVPTTPNTVTVTTITITPAPASGAMIVVYYEY